jgi:hypothetical protein
VIANPSYLAWSRFQPGASAVYAFKSWREKDGKVVPELGGLPPNRPYGWLVELYRLKSVDADAVVIEFSDRRLAGTAKVTPREQRFPRSMHKDYLPDAGKREDAVSHATGSDTVEANGGTYACKWEKTAYQRKMNFGAMDNVVEVVTIWRSEQVPGGLLMERRQTSEPNGVVLISEKLLQASLKVTDLGMLRPGIPVAFDVRSSQNPVSAAEAQKLAAALPVEQVKTTDGKLPVIPGHTPIIVLTGGDIDAAAIDAGGTVETTLAESIRSGVEVMYPKGAVVRMKIWRDQTGGASGILTAVVVNGQEVPVATDTYHLPLRMSAASTRGQAPTQPGATIPGVRIGGVGGVRLPTGRTPAPASTPAQDRRIVAANTRLIFMTAASNAPSKVEPTSAAQKKKVDQ